VPTIHREHGLRFAIYTDDHEPAHVHVLGDGELKIVIRGGDGLPILIYAVGLKTNDRRRAMDVVLERQDAFLTKWDEIQGGRG
jgi:histidinol phosphatase-like PHP family hydrolase